MNILVASVHNNSKLDTLFKLQNGSEKQTANQPELQQRFLELVAAEARPAIIIEDIETRECDDTQSQHRKMKQQLSEALATIAAQDQTIKTQATTLAETAALNVRQQEELSDARQHLRELREEVTALRTEKEQVELKLAITIDKAVEAKEHSQVLESSLKTEVESVKILRDDLAQARELATVAQLRLEELESERENWQEQQAEQASIIHELRESNTRLESEWQQVVSELERWESEKENWQDQQAEQVTIIHELRQDNTRLASERQQAISELEGWQSRGMDANMAELELSLITAQERIDVLENVIADTKNAMSDSTEQLIWYKANLQTVEDNLVQSREHASEQEVELAGLRQELAEKRAESSSRQMDILETRLADMQAILAQREKELRHSQNKITWQANYISRTKRVKRAAREHIKQLESQLESVRGEMPLN